MARIIVGQRRRRHVIGTPPDFHLLLAMLGAVSALFSPVSPPIVPLVEPPGFLHRDPDPVQPFQRQPKVRIARLSTLV
jgi:hypothetical protein